HRAAPRPCHILLFSRRQTPPRPTLFPYTTLFRSAQPTSSRLKKATCNIRAGLNIIILMQTLYITHPACHLHEMGSWHPECPGRLDRKSTRLNSSHVKISYAVFCLKKKNRKNPSHL